MTVTISMPRLTSRSGSPRSASRKTKLRGGASAAKQERARRSGTIEKVLLGLFLVLPLITLVQTLLARTNEFGVARQAPADETVLSGPRWAFTVPFAVTNKTDIERLIECESGGRNVSEPDSDGITSDGVLQFHRGPGDTLSRSTWEDFSRASGLTGSPRDPVEAIRMTDWAISHGLGPRWTCWGRQGLSPGF